MLRKKTLGILILALLSVGFLSEVCFGMDRRPTRDASRKSAPGCMERRGARKKRARTELGRSSHKSAPVFTDLDSFNPMTAPVDQFGAEAESVWHQMTVRVGSDVAVLRARIRALAKLVRDWQSTSYRQAEENGRLSEEINDLSFDSDKLQDDVNWFKGRLRKNLDTFGWREVLIKKLRRRNRELEAENEELQGAKDVLGSLCFLYKRNKHLEAENGSLQGDKKKLLGVVKQLRDELKKLRDQVEESPSRSRRTRTRRRARKRSRQGSYAGSSDDRAIDLIMQSVSGIDSLDEALRVLKKAVGRRKLRHPGCPGIDSGDSYFGLLRRKLRKAEQECNDFQRLTQELGDRMPVRAAQKAFSICHAVKEAQQLSEALHLVAARAVKTICNTIN